jgi:hypothetical protein
VPAVGQQTGNSPHQASGGAAWAAGIMSDTEANVGLEHGEPCVPMLSGRKNNIRQPAGAGGSPVAAYHAFSELRLHPRMPRPPPIGPLLLFCNCVLQVARRQSRSRLPLLRRPR